MRWIMFVVLSAWAPLAAADPQYSNTPFKEEGGDAPTHVRIDPGQAIVRVPIFAWIKDANEAPVILNYVRIDQWEGGSWLPIWEDPTDRNINFDKYWVWQQFLYNGAELAIGDSLLFRVEMQLCPGGFCDQPLQYLLKVRIAEKLPRLPGWAIVIGHVHTDGSDDPYHWGGPITFLELAARAHGHDVILLADHSPDLTDADWAYLLSECAAHSGSGLTIVPGIELTLGSAGGRVHLVAYGTPRVLKAPETCCGVDNMGSLWPISRGLDSLVSQGATATGGPVGMAAHPQRNQSIPFGNLTVWGPSEIATAMAYPRWVFAGFDWMSERTTVFPVDITEEYWNPHPQFQTNPNWEQYWNDGHVQFQGIVQDYLDRPAAIGADSDAHGDHNFKGVNITGNTQATDASYGRVHMLVNGPPTQAGVLAGIKHGAIVGTDGPAFVFTVDQDGDGGNDGTIGGVFTLQSDADFRLEGKSLAEFGNFTLARIFRTTPAGTETTTVNLSGLQFVTTIPAYSYGRPDGRTAIHMEVRTSRGYRAVTSPVYLEPQGTTDVDPGQTLDLAFAPPRPNPVTDDVLLEFTLPRSESVELRVTDVSGRMLLNQTLVGGPGRLTFRWNCQSSSGQQLPSGLYFLTLITDNAALYRRLVIVR